MAADSSADPDPELLFATVLRRRRGWWVMWIGARKKLGDLHNFRAATLTAGVTRARVMAEEFYSRDAAAPAAELLLWIFGRSQPVFKNAQPQLVVTGEPGHFMATDARDGSVLHGATLEDLLAVAGVDSARPADYHISWSVTLRDGGRGGDVWPPSVTR